MNQIFDYYEKLGLIGRLKFIRDAYSDRIPDEIIHSTDKENMYKVRGAWWTMLNAVVSKLDLEKLVSCDLIQEGDKMLDHHSMNVERTGITWPEDILAANQYLTEIIIRLESNLQKPYKHNSP